MANTNPEIRISNVTELKTQLWVDNIASDKFTPFAQILTFKQDELNTFKSEIAWINPLDDKIKKVNEIISARLVVLSQTQSQTWTLRVEIANAFTGTSKENVEKSIKEMQEKGNITPAFMTTILDTMEELKNEPEKKALVLWSIFSMLNQYWISLSEIKGNKITLKAGIEAKWKTIASHDEMLTFQWILNNAVTTWKISTKEVQTALLYRTSSLDSFIMENNGNNNIKTTDYAVRLLNKYKITISSDKPVTSENLASELKGFPQEKYNDFKNKILGAITDSQADREFMIGYLDNLKYDEGKAIQENAIDSYQKTKNKNTAIVQWLHELNKLDSATKYALWVRMTDTLEWKKQEWTNDPMGAFLKNLSGDAWILGIFMWIIGAIFWGKKWFLGGLLWGFWIWAVGVDGAKWLFNAASESWVGEAVSDGMKWVTEKFKNLPGITQWVKEKASFWYDFRDVTITEWGKQVDLLDTKFSTLIAASEGSTLWWILKKWGKNISQNELKTIQEKITEYRQMWTDKNDWDRKKFLETTTNMTTADVISYLYSTPESAVSTSQSNNPWKNTSMSQAPSDKPDLVI